MQNQILHCTARFHVNVKVFMVIFAGDEEENRKKFFIKKNLDARDEMGCSGSR